MAAAPANAASSLGEGVSNQATEPTQEKKAEKQDEPEKIKEAKKVPIEITIKQGDKIKKIVIEKPVTIKAGPDGTVVITTSEGKELKLVKEEPGHVEIEEGDLEDVYIQAEPHVHVVTPESEKEKDVHVIVKSVEHGKPHVALVGEHWEFEMQDQIREMQEQLKQVKEGKLDIQELEKSLQKLETDLKELEEMPSSFTIIREKDSGNTVRKLVIEREPKNSIFTVTVEKEGTISIVCTIRRTEKSREVYEKAVERVRKELPEGYTLEPEFIEKSGTMILKIKGPQGKEAPEDLVRKLVDTIKEELEL